MTLDSEFSVGDRIVRPHANTVSGPEGEVRVEPRAMQVLALLARHGGQVVGKKEILAEIWEGTFVSDEVLPNAIWELRKALGDDARSPRFIQTVPKRGYRLIAPVGGSEPSSSLESAERAGPSIPKANEGRSFRRIAASAAVLGAGIVSGILLSRTGGGDGDTRRTEYAVAVIGFENHASSPELAWLTVGIPTMLRTGLAEVPGARLVSGEPLREVNDSQDRRKAARRAGVSAIVGGSIFQNGPEVQVEVQVENVEEGRIVAARSARGEDVFRLMDELTLWVRETVSAEGGAPRAAMVPLQDMTTASLEAFRLYTEGTEARKHLRIRDARSLLLEAVRIDPAFALAYLELQEIAMWQRDEAGYEEFRRKTLQNQARLPRKKRMLLEAAEMEKKREPERAERILLEVIERTPDEADAYLHLAQLRRAGGRPEESLAILERGVAALPSSGYLRLYYGYGLLWQDRFPEAIDQFEAYSRINPEEANPWDSLGEAYLIAGIPDRSLEKYGRALEIDPEFSSSRLGRAWAFGQLGRFQDALSEIDAIRSDLPPHFTPDQLAFFRAYLLSRAGRYREAYRLLDGLTASRGMAMAARELRAIIEIERGRPDEALRTVHSISRSAKEGYQSPGARRHVALTTLLGGVAASRTGDLSTAKRFLAELGEIAESNDPLEQFWYHLLLGELALASGDARAAEAAFTQGEPRHKLTFNVLKPLESLGAALIFRDGAARALAAGGERQRAIELYRDLLRPDIGHKWTAVLEPRFTLALARLERGDNRREEASRRYREFLELWSDADPDLSELKEAAAYLASKS